MYLGLHSVYLHSLALARDIVHNFASTFPSDHEKDIFELKFFPSAFTKGASASSTIMVLQIDGYLLHLTNLRMNRTVIKSNETNVSPWFYVAWMNLIALVSYFNSSFVAYLLPKGISCTSAHISGLTLTQIYCARALLLAHYVCGFPSSTRRYFSDA